MDPKLIFVTFFGFTALVKGLAQLLLQTYVYFYRSGHMWTSVLKVFLHLCMTTINIGNKRKEVFGRKDTEFVSFGLYSSLPVDLIEIGQN